MFYYNLMHFISKYYFLLYYFFAVDIISPVYLLFEIYIVHYTTKPSFSMVFSIYILYLSHIIYGKNFFSSLFCLFISQRVIVFNFITKKKKNSIIYSLSMKE